MIHSPTCQHALRALIYLAYKCSPRPVLVREIAEAAGVPRQSLAKILHGLRNKGLVRSTKGPGGGYQLARPGHEMTVIEVMEAIDGPVELSQDCVLGLHDYWKGFREEYFETISAMTLSQAATSLERKRFLRHVG